MKKSFLILSNALVKVVMSGAFLLFIAGCSSDEENVVKEVDLKSRKNVEEVAAGGQLSNEKIIENYYGDDFRYGTKTFFREYGFTLTEIVVKEEVVGYSVDNGVSLQLGDIRFIESDKKLNFLDVSTYKIYVFDMVYSNEYGFYVPIFNDDSDYEAEWGCGLSMSLCTTACVLGTIGIAAADGPLPLMDVVAAAFYVACNADCIVDYENCMAD